MQHGLHVLELGDQRLSRMFQVMDHHESEHPVLLDLLLQASYHLIELCNLELKFLLALVWLLPT